MSEDVARTESRGKLARATGRVLVADNQYATVSVSCHTRVGEGPQGEQIEELGEEYLAVTNGYALALARSLALDGTAPLRLEVHAECQFDRIRGKSLLSDLALEVRGDVPGRDQQTFDAAARDPGLLESAWQLASTARVKVVSSLVSSAEAHPGPLPDELPQSLAATSTRRSTDHRPRRLRWLILVALLGVAVVIYVLVSTQAVPEVSGIVRAVVGGQRGLDRVNVAPGETVTVAGSQATASPIATATLIQARVPVATATPVQVVVPTAPPSPTLAAARQPVVPTPTLAAVSPAAAAQLATGGPFEETFAANNQRGWPDNPRSTASLTGGGYRLVPRQASSFVAVRAPGTAHFANVRVTGVFQKLGGPDGGGYGVILRDASEVPLDGLVQTGSYYVFEVGDRGEVGIWRRNGDRFTDIVPWTPSSAVHPGAGVNELIAQTQGSRLDFLVNGIQVASQQDTNLTDGSVGVFAGGDGNDVLLTRFAVQPLT